MCEHHFKLLQHIKAKNRIDLKPRKKKINRQWQRADYPAIEAKILELAEARPFFNGSDVCEAANIKPATAHQAINNVIKAGKIVATGKFAGRRLSKAS